MRYLVEDTNGRLEVDGKKYAVANFMTAAEGLAQANAANDHRRTFEVRTEVKGRPARLVSRWGWSERFANVVVVR